MTNLTFNSILWDNKRFQATGSSATANQTKANGIDFKNDTILVSAKKDFTEAQETEFNKTSKETSIKMDSTRLELEHQNLLNSYTNHLQLRDTARNLANQLTSQLTTTSEALEQNTLKIKTIETNKANLESNIVKTEGNISSLKLDKAGQLSQITAGKEAAINNHDNKISSLSNQKSSLKSSNSNLSSRISSLEAVLSNATEEEKANINSQIASLRSQISANKEKISKIEKQIEAEKTAKANTIAQYDNQYATTEANFNNQIQNAENELATLNKNLNQTNSELAEANFVQAGLLVQENTLKTEIKENNAFLRNEMSIIAKLQEKMDANKAEKENNDKKLEKASKETTTAKETTTQKQNIFEKTEKETKAKYELMA